MNKRAIELVISLYIIFILGIVVIIFSEDILPPKYFIDSYTIKDFFLIATGFSYKFSDGFWNTAVIYKFFYMDRINSQVFEGIINYTFYYLCLFCLLIVARVEYKVKTLVFLAIWNIPVAIYLGQLTKEIFIVPILVLQVYALSKKNKLLLVISFVFLIGYALFFRNYWFIILYLSIVIFCIQNYCYKYNTMFKILLVAISVFFMFVIASLKGMYLTDTRTMVNEVLESNTMINNLFTNTSFVSDLLNWLWVWLMIVFPIPLLLHIGVTQVAFGGLSILTTVVFWRKAYVLQKSNSCKKDKSINWCIAFIISFSMAQGIFEPDYGSVLKHQVVLVPMYFYLICYKTNNDLQK